MWNYQIPFAYGLFEGRGIMVVQEPKKQFCMNSTNAFCYGQFDESGARAVPVCLNSLSPLIKTPYFSFKLFFKYGAKS